tara:strand:- start:208 stop:636 length:429 start_codon:yes stop_codon:yes gene_type:complete
MASNITYPDKSMLWFVEGDKLGLLSNVDSSGNTRTTDRKQWKAISEGVSEGILLSYQGEPDKVLSINSTISIDNTLHISVVDYVKRCLYMDKAAKGRQEESAVSLSLAREHNRKFKEGVRKYGQRKREKTGGTRAVVPYDLT